MAPPSVDSWGVLYENAPVDSRALSARHLLVLEESCFSWILGSLDEVSQGDEVCHDDPLVLEESCWLLRLLLDLGEPWQGFAGY